MTILLELFRGMSDAETAGLLIAWVILILLVVVFALPSANTMQHGDSLLPKE